MITSRVFTCSDCIYLRHRCKYCIECHKGIYNYYKEGLQVKEITKLFGKVEYLKTVFKRKVKHVSTLCHCRCWLYLKVEPFLHVSLESWSKFKSFLSQVQWKVVETTNKIFKVVVLIGSRLNRCNCVVLS